MTDFSNYHTIKPKNTKQLYKEILKIVTIIYNEVTPETVKNRKNKEEAKMSDAQIIAIQLLIETLGKSQNRGYQFLKANFPKLVNYLERSRFNRLVNALMTVTRAIRKRLNANNLKEHKIVDSCPLPVIKFGRAFFGKRLRESSSYGYCASKKEVYYGMKIHAIVDIDGNPNDFIITKANLDDREAVHELTDVVKVDILFGDKGYVGKIEEELYQEKGIKLYSLQKSNSKNPLPKVFRNIVSKLRRRVETTFGQLVELFNIQRVRANSILGLQASLEVKFLCFNILSLIGGSTQISNVINFY